MRALAWSVSVLALICGVSLPFAGAAFDPGSFQTTASFELVVDKSPLFKPGTTRIQGQSAFVTLVHGMAPGNSDGLEIMFFSKPIAEASLPDIMNNDAGKLKQGDHAVMQLLLDKEKRVWQVNMGFVVPGMTVSRTIAWKPDELERYFRQVTFKDGRVVFKSTGSHSDESGEESIKLSWNVDLDLPVVREVTR